MEEEEADEPLFFACGVVGAVVDGCVDVSVEGTPDEPAAVVESVPVFVVCLVFLNLSNRSEARCRSNTIASKIE